MQASGLEQNQRKTIKIFCYTSFSQKKLYTPPVLILAVFLVFDLRYVLDARASDMVSKKIGESSVYEKKFVLFFTQKPNGKVA
jgi:hypothetical protein